MIDRKYFPSKKFLIALSIAIGVILITIIFNYWKPNITKYTNPDLTGDTTSIPEAINTDSDNDGLADWKENLYGTNPNEADTDKDGTSDLEEISLNREPTKANTAPTVQEPNDKIDPAIIEKNQKTLEEYEKLSETDKFSRNLLSNIIASQPVSGSMDENTTNIILAKALAEMPVKNYAGITKITDLNLLKTDETNLNINMTNYSKSFAAETNKLIPILGTDINIINSYISGGGTSTVQEMLKLTAKYQTIVNNLIKMPVPVAIGYYDVTYHLAVINDLEKMIAIDKDVVNSDKDSLGIFPNLSTFSNVIGNLFSTLITVDSVLKIQR